MKKKLSELSVMPARIPLCKPYISEDEGKAAAEVIRSGWLMQGAKVAEFERLISDYVGVKHAIAVNSGTSALSLALKAAGLRAGDKIIMPSHSFVATANCAVHWGFEPLFVDIAPNGYNIDPSRIGRAIDAETRAVMVVHQIGFAADMDPIMSTAKKHRLLVVEDAACSLGSTYGGRRTGSFGEVACLSFHPRKIITTGEGGMVLTDSEEIAQTVRSLRNHGFAPTGRAEPPRCEAAGYNYRMTDIQAAMGIVQLGKLEEILRLRTRLADRYRKELSGISALKLPEPPSGSVPNYQSFAAEVSDDSISRESILSYMNRRGIECRPGIQPIHREPLYAGKGSDDELQQTLRAARRSFFLPLYPSMTDDEQETVIRNLKEALNEGHKDRGVR